MANKKISELNPAAPLDGTELVEASQSSGGVLGSVYTTTADVAYAAARYGSFYDTTDQTGSISAATAVKFGTNDINTHGVTVVSNGSGLSRITYASAGTYMVAPSLQFKNSDTTDHNVTVWFARDGVALANSATSLTIPKAADGGSAYFQIVVYVPLTAGQYVEVLWLPASATLTLDATAAGAIAPGIPSAIVVTERIAK